MRDYESALRLARREAQERYPKNEYTIKTLTWCDGDFRVTAQHGLGEAGDDGNSLVERIVVTPFKRKRQLVEVTSSEHYEIHKEEEF